MSTIVMILYMNEEFEIISDTNAKYQVIIPRVNTMICSINCGDKPAIKVIREKIVKSLENKVINNHQVLKTSILGNPSLYTTS